jgi:hypothetical protein
MVLECLEPLTNRKSQIDLEIFSWSAFEEHPTFDTSNIIFSSHGTDIETIERSGMPPKRNTMTAAT